VFVCAVQTVLSTFDRINQLLTVMCGNYKCSVRRDSFFAGSHLSIVEITKIIYYWTYQYPQHIVLHITGKTKKTVVEFYNFCREVCAVILEQQSEPIGITADMEKLLKSMKVSLGKGSITAVSELMASRSSVQLKETVHRQSAFSDCV